MAKRGAFTFVLHSHLPYARNAGMWPHGEEWIHEAIADTYIPILDSLNELVDEGIDFKLTIGITPILAEQLADESIINNFIQYAAERAAWASNDVARFEEEGNHQAKELAKFYHHWYARHLTNFRDRYNRDILGAFKTLQDAGYLEIATSAATHGYLPLLSRDSSVYGQIRTGVEVYRRRFGREPKAIWLPECAYRPAYEESGNGSVTRPGLESFLASQGLEVFFSETHTVEGGRPVGKAAGEAIGLYGAVQRRYKVTVTEDTQTDPGTTFQAYWVGDAPGQVAVLGRNNRTGQQVWSGTYGYPGDYWYREFHRKDSVSGLQYWRIGGADVDLGQKPLYEPAEAQKRVVDHAAHFAHLVEELLTGYASETGKFGIISSAYDTELFGHWWFEGADWLKHVLRRLSRSEVVELTTASRIIDEHAPARVLALPESSWGAGGGHFTWLNPDTEWMWPVIHKAERQMEELVAAYPNAAGIQRDVLNQAARELLLLESSDWPFLVTTGQAKEYAIERFNEHVSRFEALAEFAAAGENLTDEQRAHLAELHEADNPFAAIDYREFAERQGRAS
ncbi:MAG TPA: 1,4-alpha-glucan branching protein domain-containing protein [Thermomicrobiales bacterium]|nr:1,4-alpha-glucan branching protein domain-containing protein [Thermomicrobiales bacterium]